MAGRWIKFLIFVFGFNIFLNICAMFIKSAVQNNREKRDESQALSPNKTNLTKEPYIIPKLRLGNVTEHWANLQFQRLQWSDSFLPENGESIFKHAFSIPKPPDEGVEFVLGVPTIAREGVDYLEGTLRSLINNLEESNNAVIVVFIGEEDGAIVERISNNIEQKFEVEIKSGLVQITSPPTHFYPEWQEQLRESFGDSFQRNKWRSKQNLDQIYIMMYTYYLQPKYYIMLEDDIIASKGYLSKIKQDIEARREQNFVLVSYCQLGAIGKLFRRNMLPSVSTFLALFWADKPLDWLLWDYMKSRVCSYSEDAKECTKKIQSIQITYKPSLFQHVGTKSSFPGKKQLLKDKSFKP